MIRSDEQRPKDVLDRATDALRDTRAPDGPSFTLEASTLEALHHLESPPHRLRFYERRSKMFRIAGYGGVAAVVVLSALFTGWLFLDRAASVALAEVEEAMQTKRLVRFTQTEINKNTDNLPNTERVAQKSTIYIDLEKHRARQETVYKTNEGAFTFLEIEDDLKGKRLMVNPQNKSATLFHFTPGEKPKSMLEELEAMRKNEATESYPEVLDGRDTIVYRLEVGEHQATITLWIDPKTKLPVKMQYDLPTLKLWYTHSDFVWNPEVADVDALFTLDPPAGYSYTEN